MGQFSVKTYNPPGSLLSANQQPRERASTRTRRSAIDQNLPLELGSSLTIPEGKAEPSSGRRVDQKWQDQRSLKFRIISAVKKQGAAWRQG